MAINIPERNIQIKVENLTKTFNKEIIVRNFSFDFSVNKSTAITGSNGSGKSTLLKLISGIILPNKGTITFYKGENKIPEEKWFQHISFCSPAQELIQEFTLTEMIDFHLRFKILDNGMTKDDFLKQTYFRGHEEKKIALFSSGMKQRLKLALALYSKSQVLLLDEPTTNMDEEGIKWYHQNILKTIPNRLVIIASNQKHEFNFCDQKIGIEDYKQH